MSFRARQARKVSCAALAFLVGGPAAAASLSGGVWDFAVDGFLREGGSEFRFDDDLQIEDDEHGVLFWRAADFELVHSKANVRGQGEVSEGTTFFGIPFSSNARIDTTVNLSDLHLRWLPLRWRFLDAGLSLKWLYGDVRVSDGEESSTEEVNEVFPLLAARARWQAGATLELAAEFDAIAADDNRVVEYRGELRWRPGHWFGTVGWWRKSYRLDNGRFVADADVAGPFLSLGREFE